MVLGAVMTALVVVFQGIGNFVPTVTTFAGAFALIPITIGACLCGPLIGGWLGLVFAIMTYFSPGVAAFLAYNTVVTIIMITLFKKAID